MYKEHIEIFFDIHKCCVLLLCRKFPNIIGAIDGCHIRISPKHEERIAYYNFKHYHSVHLQAVCIADRRFTDIFVGLAKFNVTKNQVSSSLAEVSTLSFFFFSEIKKLCNFCRWPGRAHDARVFAQSPLAEDLGELCYVPDRRIDETYHIIGDSAYPLTNNLITPYRVRKQNMTVEQKKFNTHLASKRSVIERAFGLLGQRYP